MLFAPAEKNSSCAECLEISRQLNDAYAGERRESESTAQRRPTQAAVKALRSLAGGTEEDAERADAVLDAFHYQPYFSLPKIPPTAMPALRRSAQHAARTGHWLRRLVG